MNQNQFKALNKLRSEVGKMKGMNAKGGFQYPERAPAETMGDMIHRRRAFSASNKTASPAAAWLANQMDRKDIIGSCASYVGDAHDPTSAHYQHLQKFSGGGHAFITPDIHAKITRDLVSWFVGWGQDFNFLQPLRDADALVHEAARGEGLFDLERELGVPPGNWVKACSNYGYAIYRYIIPSPKELGLRMPSGHEKNAYGSWTSDKGVFTYGLWEPFGTTSGGATEGVIPALTRKQFLEAKVKGLIKCRLDYSMADATKAAIEARF